MSCDFRFSIFKSAEHFSRCLKFAVVALILSTINSQLSTAIAFEGRINATITQGNQTDGLLYTLGTNSIRVEMTATNRPNAVDILDRNSGALTLLFPHNRSFVRLKPNAENSSPMPPAFPPMPAGLPPSIGPQSQPSGTPAMPDMPQSPNPPHGLPPGIGPTNLPGMPAMPAAPAGLPPGVGPQGQRPPMPVSPAMPAMPNMPAGGGMPSMPAMPVMPMEMMELRATGEKTNLLGFVCEQYEIKQRGETMEIWATDQLFPFQPYVQNQPHRLGPRMMEEQWPELVKARKLFPLLATLTFDNGAERFRFEVQSITPQKLTEEEAKIFQPPPGYFEIQPLPF